MSNNSNEKKLLDNKMIKDYAKNLVAKPKSEIIKNIGDLSNNNPMAACQVGIELIISLKNSVDNDYDGFKILCDNSIKVLKNLTRNENLTSEAQVEIVKTINKILDKSEKAFNKKMLVNAGICVSILGTLGILATVIFKSNNNGGTLK